MLPEDTKYLNSNALLAYNKGKADGVEQEHRRIVAMFRQMANDAETPVLIMRWADTADRLEDSK